ncbi:MAG TPA: 2-oxoglutarate dehydrogenase, E2 component, dihydrolipoamide succinyltransferase, partial [Jiangellaceae bacterium]|nr:2-oxoglutarate dehydrogenase, E2 component, dihydrolipoamide succinyltransferase [Jiangellaceae bacterium]
EEVQVDEPLLEVSTDKVDTEIPSPASGTLLEIKVAEDETVEVGTELAVIGDSADGGGADAGDTGTQQDRGTQEAVAEEEPVGAEAQAEPEQKPEAEPAAPGDQPAETAPAATMEAKGDSSTEPEPAPSPEPAQPARAGGGADGTSVTLPALGESVTEGTVIRWLKQPGEEVQVDEPLLEVSTDKVDTEIPSPASGTLLEIKVAEDETVEVGTVLAVIGSTEGAAEQRTQPEPAQPESAAPQPASGAETPMAAEAGDRAAAEAQSHQQAEPAQAAPAQAAPAETTPAQAAPAQAAPAGGGGDGSPYVTPLVRKLATEHSVDLATLRGTGVGGRIRKQDVLAAAEQAREAAEQPAPAAAATAPAAPPAPATAAPAASQLRGTTVKMSRLRSIIARRMIESLQVSAQLTTVLEVDVSAITRLRQQAKASFLARESVKLSYLPFFAKATVEALKAHPSVNATIDTEKGEITYFDAEHLGIAVDTDRGLLVPVIRDAGDLNIAGLARKIADLADRTRNNKIKPDELSGGTFTLTNTGSRGVLIDTPIINQPQVGILGTGAVVKRPVVVTDDTGADSIAIRSMAYLSLTYDHRLVDGADAARFLGTIKQRLEGGQFEGELGI